MTRFAAFIRGINVGGHSRLSMAELRAACESLGLKNVRTYLQSGNVVFDGTAANANKLEKAIGYRVMLRTPEELRAVVEAHPFRDEAKRDPARTVVFFLADTPSSEITWPGPEKAARIGRELYAFYPNGMGKSKLTGTFIEKKLGVAATARNHNTVAAMLEMVGQAVP
jgi:uncharacterized protein (DUF1697 family)